VGARSEGERAVVQVYVEAVEQPEGEEPGDRSIRGFLNLELGGRVEVLDVGDLPVGVGELGTFVSDVILAARVSSLGGTALGLTGVGVVPDTTGPVTTKRAGEDVDVVVKVLVGVTLSRGEVGHGSTPLVGHGLFGSDITGDLVSREPPDHDTRLVPFHCGRAMVSVDGLERVISGSTLSLTSIDTTSDVVESVTVSSRVLVSNTTSCANKTNGQPRRLLSKHHSTPQLTLVGSSIRSTVQIIKVTRSLVTRLPLIVGHPTSIIGMHRDLVDLEVVDTLKDINLTPDRPVGTVLPPSGPSGTPDGHVDGVHED